MAKTKYKDTEKPVGPRARNDAYVMMLFITFLAIVGGTVLMYLDHEEYGSKAPPPAPKIGEASAVDTKTGGPAGVGAGPVGGVPPGGAGPMPPPDKAPMDK